MKKIIFLIIFNVVLTSCFDLKKESNESLKVDNNTQNTNEVFFTDIEEFKRFVLEVKWVDIANKNPCDPHGQHITIKDGFIDEYNTIEPSQYKVDTITQIDSKTLGIKIKSKSKRDVIFKVKVIDLEKKIVKWIYNYNEYEAKPYDVICVGDSDKNKENQIPKENSFNKKWEGFYQFSNAEEGDDWRAGSDYDLYISLDSVNLKSYGYQHDRNRKSYAIEKEGNLFIYSQDIDEGLLLKLIIKNKEYVATSLVDKKGEFKVLKK